MDKVDQPRIGHREIRTADAEQIAKLRDALSGTPYALAFEIYVGTGIRRGELCGLRWEDLDFQTGSLTVRRSVEQINTSIRIKEPKSDSHEFSCCVAVW